MAPQDGQTQGDEALGYGEGLAPGGRAPARYAAGAVPTRGRLVPEAPCPTRSHLQRDRDRVLHSVAFRRLIHKTQMFLFHEGDHYRTRLTHSLEVAQIARTIARQIRLDEDLAEALALAHDLGHPPFGHAGETALDDVMRPWGGFDHNVQSFRVVAVLERPYLDFDGLNLSWETLEGLAKHNGPAVPPRTQGDRALVHALRDWPAGLDLELDRHGSGEAQVAAISDDIAWMTHDIDDGLRARLIALEDLADAPLAGPVLERVRGRAARGPGRVIYEVVRQLITLLIADVVATSRANLARLAPQGPADIRNAGRPVIAFSAAMQTDITDLRTFLFARLYRAPRVMTIMTAAQDLLRDLIGAYLADPAKLPESWRTRQSTGDERRRARLVADFVAGMTDRYAIGEHRRLFDATPELR